MSMTPDPRRDAVLECFAMDLAELNAALGAATAALTRLAPHLECLALDMAEMDPPFDDGDVRVGRMR